MVTLVSSAPGARAEGLGPSRRPQPVAARGIHRARNRTASVVQVFVLGVDPGVSRCGYAVLERERPRRACAGHRRDHDARRRTRCPAGWPSCSPSSGRCSPSSDRRRWPSSGCSSSRTCARRSRSVRPAASPWPRPRPRGCDVVQYSPNQVKEAVAGYGGATKEQMQDMVQTLLGLAERPRPADAADAAAVALCHLAIAPIARGRGTHARSAGMIGSLRGTLLERWGDGELLVEVRRHRLPASRSRPPRWSRRAIPGTRCSSTSTTTVARMPRRSTGSFDRDEQWCFEALIGAHGVGPTLALAILAVHSPLALQRVLSDDDLAALCLVPGVGQEDGGAPARRAEGPPRSARCRARRTGRQRHAGATGPGLGARRRARGARRTSATGVDEVADALRELPDEGDPAELLKVALQRLAVG